MKRVLHWLRQISPTFGLVEQSQIVASTAVVVAMVTIIGTYFFSGKQIQWLDFISIVTVGVIGFVSVYFSLKYGRQLEDQRRELLALNAVAEAVSHSVELEYVLHTALHKVAELLGGDFGWIYLAENRTLLLKHRYGTRTEFFPGRTPIEVPDMSWIYQPHGENLGRKNQANVPGAHLVAEGLRSWASTPLERQDEFAGILILGARDAERFTPKRTNLLHAFGNQIGIALHNSSLFEQVRQSEKKYADLYEHSPDMYHSVTRDGIVASCNITESEMLGYSKDEIVGKSLPRLYPTDSLVVVQENLRRMFEKGEELRGVEEQMRKKDGTLIDVSLNASLVFDGEGHPILARIVARDITQKKRMEQQILHAQKIDSIGNLAGGIAHDFNNILTSILGSASIMKRHMKEGDLWYAHVDLMEMASRRGASLTRQLLTFARKSSVHIRPLDLNAIIRDTLRLVEASLPKSILLRTELTSGSLVFNGDDGQVQQAILNLCINARDAMPEEGLLHIETGGRSWSALEASRFPDALVGDYISVSVMDNGIGIPENLHSRIFEPFFTTKQQGKGTGLGLSVVYGVVKSHNGFISLESAMNVGTKITLHFPRVRETELIKRTQQPRKIEGGSEHILLVEDESAVNKVVTDMLRELGYSVEAASDGRQAIEMVRNANGGFELVILDMNMPHLGGKETFRRMKELHPSLRVLISTGYSEGILTDEAFLRSVDGLIQKPYTVDDIALKVREILDEGVVSRRS